jgi:hypothetical protein
MNKSIRKKVLGIITITILIVLILSIHAPSLYSVGTGNGYGGCTGTIGYWKTHPEEWPIDTIVIGGVQYSKAEAIEIMDEPAQGDKTYTMFEQLVAAKLNVEMGAESSCIDDSIVDADQWLIDYPLGSGVKGKLWEETGEPIKDMLDNYNNGHLCAPKCD